MVVVVVHVISGVVVYVISGVVVHVISGHCKALQDVTNVRKTFENDS